jgi:hypothetical protein
MPAGCCSSSEQQAAAACSLQPIAVGSHRSLQPA